MLKTTVKSSKNVRVIDRGMNRIAREISLTHRSHTKIGFPTGGKVGEATKKGQGTKLESFFDMSEIATIAAFNNFGTKRIPQREFMGSTFDENYAKLNSLVTQLYKKITDGTMTTRIALSALGEFGTVLIKKKIVSLKSPPNAPATIRKKKSSNPLIDKGQMVNSVGHVETLRMGKK